MSWLVTCWITRSRKAASFFADSVWWPILRFCCQSVLSFESKVNSLMFVYKWTKKFSLLIELCLPRAAIIFTPCLLMEWKSQTRKWSSSKMKAFQQLLWRSCRSPSTAETFKSNVFEVLVAADHLQVKTVVQQCCDYLQNQFVQLRFDVQTYCQICIIANRHGLTDLQEARQSKMASMYREVCENEEFLSHIDADQLSHLLSRDDLSAPSETFVFKSVMQWIKHKKEARMPVAAKVIGAVRLGLVNIKDLVEELETDEMQQMPEIHMLLYESLLHFARPSNSSNFAKEKAQRRSRGRVSLYAFTILSQRVSP